MKARLLTLWLVIGCGSHWLVSAAALLEGPSVEFRANGQATIRWQTDVATASRVQFGDAPARLSRRAEGAQGPSHTVTMPPLEPGTKWFYSVGTARVPLATNSFIVPGKAANSRAPSAVPSETNNSAPSKPAPVKQAPPARATWGHFASLQDHFDRHGRDFNAKDPEDYARLAWEFRQRAELEGLPTKIDAEGVRRVFDPKTGAFAAYNRDGTTKTFFKPNRRDYFERQPGERVKPTSPH